MRGWETRGAWRRNRRRTVYECARGAFKARVNVQHAQSRTKGNSARNSNIKGGFAVGFNLLRRDTQNWILPVCPNIDPNSLARSYRSCRRRRSSSLHVAAATSDVGHECANKCTHVGQSHTYVCGCARMSVSLHLLAPLARPSINRCCQSVVSVNRFLFCPRLLSSIWQFVTSPGGILDVIRSAPFT